MGRTRSVHVGFPRITPANFDLVIATSQYPAADHPKLLRIPFALTAAGVLGHPRAADPLLLALPSPRRLLLVGGPNIYWKLDEQALEARLAALIEDAQRDGGSIIVSTSPRTPPKVEQAMYAALMHPRTDVAREAEAALRLPGSACRGRFHPRHRGQCSDGLGRDLDRQADGACPGDRELAWESGRKRDEPLEARQIALSAVFCAHSGGQWQNSASPRI